MNNTIKSVLFFLIFAWLYFVPIYVLIFLVGVLFVKFTNPGDSVVEFQAVGWLIMICSIFISIIVTPIMSTITVKKTILRKVKEDGTKEKISKHILVFISIALVLNIVLILFLAFSFFRGNKFLNRSIMEQPTIYNIEASNEIFDFENESYVFNSYMFKIKENYENNYIINFNNLIFKNRNQQISYQVSNDKKTIFFNDKEIITKSWENENLVGISIYSNYLKISEMIEKKYTINKNTILDDNGNIIYEYYAFTDVNSPYTAFEIVDDTDKDSIIYNMYNLTLNNDIFEIDDLVQLKFDCTDFQTVDNVLKEEEEFKYYICNN